MAGHMTPGSRRPWPRIREELELHPGPCTRFGAPTWTLHDPVGQLFFRLGWLEMEILQRWHLAAPEAIVESLSRETTLTASSETVMLVHGFLVANNLVVAEDQESTARFLRQKQARKKSVLSLLLHNYLFLRIPLFKPDAFLHATLGWVNWMFSRVFLYVLVLAAVCGLFVILREWSRFSDNLSSLLTLQGGLMAAAALGLSKTVHEFGHAYAAKRLRLKVPTMGVALMCFAPVLWTDTTEAWKLPSRRDRLGIGVAGVMAELTLAAAASLLWPLLPAGALKTAAFMLAGSVWILTLTVNINPCMRYDGYYLLSDYWDIPGLQGRSFALGKWWLREELFGFGLPPPEALPGWERRKLIVYALVTWVYRFFLFLGIALLVYHYFFKALGIVLMMVELAFFISLPILKEIRHWLRNRMDMTMNFRLLRTLVIMAVVVAFFVVPWHGSVGGAALLTTARRTALYAPLGAVVEAVHTKNNLVVEEGAPLFDLKSPDLESRLEIARRKVTAQRLKLSLASLDLELRVELTGEWEQLERLAEDLAGLLREQANLKISAPFAGRVVDLPEWLTPESWVMAKEPLAALVGGADLVQVFIPEHARERIHPGASGWFYPAGRGRDPLRLRVESVESQATRDIAWPELASPYGGPLGAHRSSGDRLEPDQSVYRVVCRVEGEAPNQFLVGQASLAAEPMSLVSDIWRRFLGLLVRESGW